MFGLFLVCYAMLWYGRSQPRRIAVTPFLRGVLYFDNVFLKLTKVTKMVETADLDQLELDSTVGFAGLLLWVALNFFLT